MYILQCNYIKKFDLISLFQKMSLYISIAKLCLTNMTLNSQSQNVYFIWSKLLLFITNLLIYISQIDRLWLFLIML